MSHPRAGIRHYVRNMLKTPDNTVYPTDAKGNVFAMRTIPVQREDTPAVAIYTLNEEVDNAKPYFIGDDPVRRILNLNIEIYAIDEFNEETGQIKRQADDIVDEIAFQIEGKIVADPTLGQRVDQVKYQTFELGLVGGEEGAPVVVATQTWEVGYYTMPPEPESGTLPTAVFINAFEPFGQNAEDEYRRYDPDEDEITTYDG